MNIGIIGYGYVGKSTEFMIPNSYNILIYDTIDELKRPKILLFQI